MISTLDRSDSQVGMPKRWRSRRLLTIVTAGCLLAAAIVAVLVVQGRPGNTDVAPGVNRASASVLSLDVLSRASIYQAPDFSLTDQRGQPMSLRTFRGDSVVLSFNDDRCPDLCTLLAQAVVVARHDLAGGHVVFLSVNVNPFFPQVEYVRQWSHNHGLDRVPAWYFGTASVPILEQIWHAYGVYVQTDPQTQTVVHGSQLFFIDPGGRVRAVGDFGLDAADTQYFAHAMSQMAVDLLPSAERYPVGGPVTPPGVHGAISPKAPAPDFLLPRLGAVTPTVSLQSLSGKPTVITFWSSKCASCEGELAALQAAHQDLGTKVNFVGIDEADSAGAGRAVGARSGVTFPLATDGDGSVATLFDISGLPYSYIVSPQGTFDIIHPGIFTTEQVEYVLKSFYPTLDAAGS